MLLLIDGLLNKDELDHLSGISRELKFVDGRISNPANQTKKNLQADPADPRYLESSQIVAQAVRRSREFAEATFPRQIAPPLLCRYEPGMTYGVHADAAYMVMERGTLRSDISCTVFVSDPDSYEGGELRIHLGIEPITVKGRPGQAFVYPSTTLHEVLPVRSGVRVVSITFVESRVQDEFKRDQIYELNEIAALEGLTMRWESRVRLDAVRQNLLRLWSS